MELSLGFRVADLAAVEGLDQSDAGPSTLLAFKELLAACPSARSIQLATGGSGEDSQAALLKNWLFRALQEAGRRVTLELCASDMTPSLAASAAESGLPLRVALKYGNGGTAAAPRGELFETIWQLQAAKPSDYDSWRDPAFVRRVLPLLSRPGCQGFEIDAPSPIGQSGDAPFYRMWGRLTYDPNAPEKSWREALDAK
jgi:hypothetical protein